MEIKLMVNLHSRKTITMPLTKYEAFRDFIVNTLISEKEITLNDLLLKAQQNPSLPAGSDTNWCLLKVKQDLEVRRLIKIQRSIGPDRAQMISLIKSRR